MNNPDPRDKDLRESYDAFSVGHESQRDELMQLIADEPKVIPAKKAISYRLFTFSRMVTALAAVLMLAVGTSLFWGTGTSKAYGIETLTQRLLAIRSLHVRGFLVQEIVTNDGVKETKQFPIRWFFERPKRLWLQSYGFSDQGNGQATIVSQHKTGIDGDLQVSTDPLTGDRDVVPVDPRTTELMVELLIQSLMFEQLVNGPTDQFAKVSAETIDGVDCDVYELKSSGVEGSPGSLQRIWLDPRDGLPVRMDLFLLRNGAEPELALTLSEIRVNEEAPGDLFPLDRAGALPPREFAGIESVGSASAGPTRLGAWYALRLNSTKALVCWTQHSMVSDKVEWFAHEPAFKITDDHSSKALQVETLREFESNGVRWRWSLVSLPSGEELDRRAIQATVEYDRHSASFETLPLQFPADRLRGVFDYMQELTPGGSSDKNLSLEALTK